MLVKFLIRAIQGMGNIYLKIRASEIHTSEIRASQGPPVLIFLFSFISKWLLPHCLSMQTATDALGSTLKMD